MLTKEVESLIIREYLYELNPFVTVWKNGEAWFFAKDACSILGLKNSRQAITDFPESEKDVITADTLGGPQTTSVISEAGLYRLIFQSRKPEAEKFKTWVVSVVLPEIRKTGKYEVPKTLEQRTLEIMAELTARVEEMKPKAEFHDQITSAPDCYSISDAVRILDLNEGRNKFFTRLRTDKILMTDNMPYQDQVDSGHFRVVVSIKNGKSIQTPLVTGSGLSYLQRKYKELRK